MASQSQSLSTQGNWFPTPNSLIENFALLTRAELGMSLIVLRGNGFKSIPRAVSDNHWSDWTGLSPRMMEHAAMGLQKKGVMQIEGRGNKARYMFDKAGWEEYVRHATRTQKPRTDGRRSVDPKPGARVHPDCRERGCALLCANSGPTAVTLDSTTNIAKPVSQVVDNFIDPGTVSSGGTITAQDSISQLFAIQVAKPVSQIVDAAGEIWALALAAVQSAFPIASMAFLLRLVAVVRSFFPDVTDAELARAVEFAWRGKGRVQKSEMLFLVTVPDALRYLRKHREPETSKPVAINPFRVAAIGMLQATAIALDRLSGPWAAMASSCRGLIDSPLCAESTFDPELLEKDLQSIETAMIAQGHALLSTAQKVQMEKCVSEKIEEYPTQMSSAQADRLREQFRSQHVIEVFGLERLSLLYVKGL